jgi:hypothetical protein
MKKHRNALERLLVKALAHASTKDLARKFLYLVLAISAMISATAFSDEWRPRHALVPPTGVLNLTQPAGPADVLLPGPENPAAADAWRTQMKAWRQERLQRLRYQGAEYDRPELAWTQHVYAQVQLLIWDRTFFDPARINTQLTAFSPTSKGASAPSTPSSSGPSIPISA